MKAPILCMMFALSCVAQNRSVQMPTGQEEALVVCPEVRPSPQLTSYEFAKFAIVSLWYARNGAERGTEITKVANETDNMFSFLTAMMRITKNATNDFICAKRAVKPFATMKDDNAKLAAQFLSVVYDAHININQRLLDVIRRMDDAKLGQLTDQISTLQVERSQRWADLFDPITLVVAELIDLKRTDQNGKATYLSITKAQKKALLDWSDEHFTEFKNGTPEKDWSEPTKASQLFSQVFQGRKCSDE